MLSRRTEHVTVTCGCIVKFEMITFVVAYSIVISRPMCLRIVNGPIHFCPNLLRLGLRNQTVSPAVYGFHLPELFLVITFSGCTNMMASYKDLISRKVFLTD